MSKRSKIHNCFKVSRWELNNIEVNYSEYFYFEVFTNRYLKRFCDLSFFSFLLIPVYELYK